MVELGYYVMLAAIGSFLAAVVSVLHDSGALAVIGL